MTSPSTSAEEVAHAWTQVVDWLAANAPAAAASLQPPAEPSAILEAEQTTEMRWHPELTALFELVNGSGSVHDGVQVFPDMTLISVTEAVLYWKDLVEVRSPAVPPANDRAEPQDVVDWSPKFIPFAADNFGRLLFVDHRAGPAHGGVGRWESADLGRTAVWSSVTAALRAVAGALDSDEALFGYKRPQSNSERLLRWS